MMRARTDTTRTIRRQAPRSRRSNGAPSRLTTVAILRRRDDVSRD